MVIPENLNGHGPALQRVLRSWRNLLVNAELVERGVLFNAAAYDDIRIPKMRGRWWFGKKNGLIPRNGTIGSERPKAT
jgi:hypothetical protein